MLNVDDGAEETTTTTTTIIVKAAEREKKEVAKVELAKRVPREKPQTSYTYGPTAFPASQAATACLATGCACVRARSLAWMAWLLARSLAYPLSFLASPVLSLH